MKKKELLYRAVGDLDDRTVNDAIEHKTEKRDHSRRFVLLEAAAIVAVVCGMIALSVVLLKLSGPKTPADSGAASGEETAETTVTEETADTSDTSAETVDFIREPIYKRVAVSIEDIYATEPFAGVLPREFVSTYGYMKPLYSERLVYDEEYEKLSGVSCDKDYTYYVMFYIIDKDGVISDYDYMDYVSGGRPEADMSRLGIFQITVRKPDRMPVLSYTPDELTADIIRSRTCDNRVSADIDCGEYLVSYSYSAGIDADPSEMPPAEEFYKMIVSSDYAVQWLSTEHEPEPKSVCPTLEEIYNTEPYDRLLPQLLLPYMTPVRSLRSLYNEKAASSGQMKDGEELVLYEFEFMDDRDGKLTDAMKDVKTHDYTLYGEAVKLGLPQLVVEVFKGVRADSIPLSDLSVSDVEENIKNRVFDIEVNCSGYTVRYFYHNPSDMSLMPSADELFKMITSAECFGK